LAFEGLVEEGGEEGVELGGGGGLEFFEGFGFGREVISL
jgi:hypothetical protein